MGSAATTTAWPPKGSRYIPSTSPPSALTLSAVRRASSVGSAISATVRPLLLAACLLRGGLRFLAEGLPDVFFAGMCPHSMPCRVEPAPTRRHTEAVVPDSAPHYRRSMPAVLVHGVPDTHRLRS